MGSLRYRDDQQVFIIEWYLQIKDTGILSKNDYPTNLDLILLTNSRVIIMWLQARVLHFCIKTIK